MQNREVIGYVIATQEWLKFESISWAAEYFNVCKNSVVQVIKGNSRQTNGVCFHYNTEDFDEQILAKVNRESRKGQHSKKTIVVTDKQGNKIANYIGIREAARQLGLSITTISRCANGLRNSSIYNFKMI